MDDRWTAASDAFPDTADAEFQLQSGHRLNRTGDLKGAAQCYSRAIQLDPSCHAAYNNLGTIFASLGDRTTALAFFQAALGLRPDHADVHNNIGNIRFEQGERGAAIESYRRAVALQPGTAVFHNNLGNALCAEGRYVEAEVSLRQALDLNPRYGDAAANLGFLFYERELFDRAEEWYCRAIALKPDHALAHVCLGQILLRRGEFERGWAEQEWRWRWKNFPSPKRAFPQPQWKGEEMRGKRIFVHAEQGLGDTIQFLRYVALLRERGATVLLEVHPELRRLAETLPGVAHLTVRGEPVPECDWHCPLLSLPAAFSTVAATIPARVPYLRASVEPPAWLGRKGGKRMLRVGLAWAGSRANAVDHKRSLPLCALAPLFAIEGVSFHSLQRGPAAEEARTAVCRFASLLPEAVDMADTAAAIAHLDLVVAADTAVAHLAGALAKPVWVLLPHLADWRWLTDREDSPWYPTATLFRQETAGRWETVVGTVRRRLPMLVKDNAAPAMLHEAGAASGRRERELASPTS